MTIEFRNAQAFQPFGKCADCGADATIRISFNESGTFILLCQKTYNFLTKYGCLPQCEVGRMAIIP